MTQTTFNVGPVTFGAISLTIGAALFVAGVLHELGGGSSALAAASVITGVLVAFIGVGRAERADEAGNGDSA